MEQANTVNYNFITNGFSAEAVSLGYHAPQGFRDVNTSGEKVPQFLLGFNLTGLRFWTERKDPYSTRGNAST